MTETSALYKVLGENGESVNSAWAAAWAAGSAAWDARAAKRVATGAAGDAALACMTERLFQYLRGEARP